MARRDVSLRRECLAAIRAEADIASARGACRDEAIDPTRTSVAAFAAMHGLDPPRPAILSLGSSALG